MENRPVSSMPTQIYYSCAEANAYDAINYYFTNSSSYHGNIIEIQDLSFPTTYVMMLLFIYLAQT